MSSSVPSTSSHPVTSSPLLVALAWAVVVIPAAWGLDYTVKNALKIFTAPPSTSAPASTAVPK